MAEQTHPNGKFEGLVLGRLDTLDHKIDGVTSKIEAVNQDLKGDIETLFDLLDKRDDQLKAHIHDDHGAINTRLAEIEKNAAVTTYSAQLSSRLWERVFWIGLTVVSTLVVYALTQGG